MRENEPIIISAKQAEDSVFCFLGEFGYEMISWLPYLLFLKQNLNIKLHTVSRKGSKPFYYFSDEHFEAEPSLIGDMWGDTKHYNQLASIFPGRLLIHPGPDFINQRKIIIEGKEWTNNNIHTIINQKNYSVPDFSGNNIKLPFEIQKPFIVINNKFFRQWYQKYKGPINYFRREDLEEMRDILQSLGYSIVYNHFVEQTSYDQFFDLNDRDIFGKDSHSVNLADFYKNLDAEGRNILQLSVYNNAEFVIGPQGGNLYLPAICKKDLWILMRDGEYLDYLEFGRLYGINVNIFYEPAHILASIKYFNDKQKLKNTTQKAIEIVHSAYTGIVKEDKSEIQPLISICIFTYNRGNLIAETIQSCLEQSYNNFEIIIADDGSTDNTAEVVKSFNDARIKYFYKAHTNAPDTRNYALKHAKGDYIIWVGSDDILDKSILEEYVNTLKSFPDADILYCNLQSFDNQGNKGIFLSYQEWYGRNPEMLAFLFEGSPIADGGTLIKKSIYDEVGQYNTEFTRAQDYEFWSRVVLSQKFKAKYVNKTLYYYRIHDGNLTGHLNEKTDFSFERKILQNVIDKAGFEKLFLDFSWNIDYDYNLSMAYLKAGLKFLERQGVIEGINYISQSIEIYPDAEKFKLLSEIYLRLNQFEPAKTILTEAYKQFPYDEWIISRLQGLGVDPSSITINYQLDEVAKDELEDFVNICIVTYNRLEFTKQCIDGILKHTDYPYVITVVDNNSQDGTKEYLKKLKDEGKIKNLVLLDENIGVAKASNLAWSLEPNAKYYMKLDNDIVIQKPAWLSAMINVAENVPKIGALAYNFEPKSYPIQIINGFKIRIKNPHNLGGACILIPKRTEKQLGYWCEDYGLYGEEDADYGIRIHCAGLFNAYMEDENIGIHLPAGKAGVIDPYTMFTKDGIEESEDREYRLFKDESRRRNVSNGAFTKNYNDYIARKKSLFVDSLFAKSFDISKYLYKSDNQEIIEENITNIISSRQSLTEFELESNKKAFLPILLNVINQLNPKNIVSIGNFNYDYLEPICLAKEKLNPNLKILAFVLEDLDVSAIEDKIQRLENKFPNYISFFKNTFFEALIGLDDKSADLIIFDSLIKNEDLDFYIDSILPKLSNSGLVILPNTNISLSNETNWKSWQKLTWDFENIEFDFGGGFGLIFPKNQSNKLKNYLNDLKSNKHIYTERFRAEAFKLSSKQDLSNTEYSSDIEKFEKVLDYLEKTQIAMSRLDYSSVNQLEKEFINLFPDSPFAYLTSAIIKRHKNELNESVRLIEQARDLFEIPEVIYEMKVIAGSKGNVEKSREINDYIQLKYPDWNFSPSDSDYISLIFSSAIERLKQLKNNFNDASQKIELSKIQEFNTSASTKIKTVKIGFLSIEYHNNACPVIRLITPLKSLEKEGFGYQWIDVGELIDGKLEPKIENILSLDILIIQRQICGLIPFNALKSLIKEKDIKIVFEIDDALTDLPFHHPHYLHFERFRPFIYEYIKNADLVTVSTEGLKKLYSSHSDKIVVLKNYFSKELITKKVEFPRYSDGPVKILFSGTITHEPDFKEIEGVLRRILNEFGEAVELLMWGGTTFSSLSQQKNVRIIDEFYNDYYDYLKRLQTIEADFAVIPLNDNTFNRAKSHIKWVEYSACGIPGIYSNVGEYSVSIKNEVTGILVDNNYEQWYSAVRRFIEDENFRENIAKNAYNTVHNEFTIENNCYYWDKAYRSILSFGKNETFEEPKSTIESSIIIPVHNQLHYTKNCLEGLFKTVDLSKVEIIIINNASTDGTGEYLQSLGNRIKVITNQENLNYSKINNQGAKIASGKYLIFLNNDTLPLPGWYDEIIKEFEENQDTGIQGAKLLYEDGTIQHAGMVFGSMPNKDDSPFHAYVKVPADFHYANLRRQFQFVTGACLAIRSDLFGQIGGFDEGYDFGWEDTDLCMKVNQIGKKVIYNPKAVLYHYESGTKVLKEEAMNDFLLPQSSRDIKNRLHFMDKWSQFVKKDADEFFRNDGFKLENGMLFPINMQSAQLIREITSNKNLTSFSSSFWNFNYENGKNILIRITPAFGDALMMTSIIHKIKSDFPHIDIYVSGAQIIESVFEGNPDIKEFIIKDSDEERRLISNIDRILDYNNLIANLPEYYNGLHFMDILANIAGIKLNSKELIYNITNEEINWAENVINNFSNGSKIIGLQLITNKDTKRSYPYGNELLTELRKRYPEYKYILFGLHENYGNGADTLNCGEKGYTFRQQVALANFCDSFITIDSVFFHVAHNLLKKPTLLIAGLTNPALIGNYTAGFSVIRNNSLDCLNCYWTKKCNIECMNQLSPEIIASAFSNIENTRYTPDSFEIIDVKLNWNTDYQKSIYDFFANYSNKNKSLRLIDQDGILPSHSLNWNGIEIRYSPAKTEQLSFDFSSNVTSFEKLEIIQKPKEIKKTDKKLNVVWEGSQFVYHSLALINREHCSNLINVKDVELTIIPYEPETYLPEKTKKNDDLIKHDIRFKEKVDESISKLPYVWIRHQWPPQFQPPKGAKWIIMQPWEFSTLRKDFADLFNQADEIWTPSNYSRQSFINSGVDFNKVQVIPNGIDPEIFKPTGDKFELKTNKKLKFLFVGGTIFRKGIDILLNSYASTFNSYDDVCLVVKDMGGDSFYKGQTAKEQIEILKVKPNSPEIIYIDNALTELEMASLYRACDVFVCPYRGEGFSLPTLEAMACGLPVVVTKGGSTDDFTDEDIAWYIPAMKRSIGNVIDGHQLTGEAFVLEPEQDALSDILREIYNKPSAIKLKGILAAQKARNHWTWKRATLKVLSRLDVLYDFNLASENEKILSDEKNEIDDFLNAEFEFQSKNYKKAEELFLKAVSSDNSDLQHKIHSYLRLAEMNIIKKDLENSLNFIKEAEKLNNDNTDVKYIKSKYLALTGNDTEALELLTELFNEWKTRKFETFLGITLDDLLTDTADIFLSFEDAESALSLYTEALKYNTTNARACLGAGKCFLTVLAYEEAQKMLDWAKKLDPDLSEASILLEDILEKQAV
ncbi:MAG: glycosyltransferase [Candidatus Kapabacteria bacterium]|nr:glycosyltransferase [Candidatus Kapabacteria bacterium]